MWRPWQALALCAMWLAACSDGGGDADGNKDTGVADTAIAGDGEADGGASDGAGSDSGDADDGADDATEDSVIPDAGGAGGTDADDGVDAGEDGDDGDGSHDDGSDGDVFGDGAASDADADAGPGKVCSIGESKCAGALLATCGPLEDGFVETKCFPGLTCSEGKCVPVSNNLIIAFDTSGSMTGKVNSCSATGQMAPTCDPTKACTRMDVSKVVFTKALGKIDDKITRMALFRFPQKLTWKTSQISCTSGYYSGQSTLTTDKTGAQSVGPTSSWFWEALHETESVPFPVDDKVSTKAAVLGWMNGTEAMKAVGSCSAPTTSCAPVAGCAGTCCAGTCYVHDDPELRPTGGTPIGKTLFYIGEYLRNRVVIDGKTCAQDADCANVNYKCQGGVCKDPARSCRETIVVLFTDGGESNSPSNYFGPWVQAKRMAFGLGCQTDGDCVGGTSDDPIVCKAGSCLPKFEITGYYCSKTGAPCLPNATSSEPTFCAAGSCTPDPRDTFTAKATTPADNVLRSPDGKPFGVRLYVVDISGATDMKNSMSLAISGNGKLLGADAEDPAKFLAALETVFDIKNAKVCGDSF